MWYVVQVRTGTEESVRKQYEKMFGKTGAAERCFIPYREEARRCQGAWHKEKKILFPGYVFMISGQGQIERLFHELKQVIGLTKLLGTGTVIIPLTPEETDFLTRIGGDAQIVTMSKGIIEQDRIIVTEGPLAGWEGLICRIDRHKRKAWIEVEMFGRLQKVETGLEILEKK